jgi:hypothetical protein
MDPFFSPSFQVSGTKRFFYDGKKLRPQGSKGFRKTVFSQKMLTAPQAEKIKQYWKSNKNKRISYWRFFLPLVLKFQICFRRLFAPKSLATCKPANPWRILLDTSRFPRPQFAGLLTEPARASSRARIVAVFLLLRIADAS